MSGDRKYTGMAKLFAIEERQQKEREAQKIEPSAQRLTGQPVNQPLVNQSTTLVNQLTSKDDSPELVNQLTSQPEPPNSEPFYRSRRERKLKGVRLPVNKIEKYELWCLLNKADFQEAVEFALDWLTSQPVNQLTGQPVNQLTTLINNDLNNESVINDAKAERVFNKYKELTGRQATKKDMQAYGEVAHLEYAVIEHGLHTAIQRAVSAGSRVNSFRYTLNCIREAASQSSAQQGVPEADTSSCPDCQGSGFWYPEGTEKGVAKCKHERMGK